MWHPLGTGFERTVSGIAVAGRHVYVGGLFTDVGGNARADHIVRWDGSSWHTLGPGLNDAVFPIAVSGADIYVGGEFTNAGGNTRADYITRWGGPVSRIRLPLVARDAKLHGDRPDFGWDRTESGRIERRRSVINHAGLAVSASWGRKST